MYLWQDWNKQSYLFLFALTLEAFVKENEVYFGSTQLMCYSALWVKGKKDGNIIEKMWTTNQSINQSYIYFVRIFGNYAEGINTTAYTRVCKLDGKWVCMKDSIF